MQGLQYLSLTKADLESLSLPMSRAYRANQHHAVQKLEHAPLSCDQCLTLLSQSLTDPDNLCFKVCLGGIAIGAFVIHWNEFGDSELRHLFIDAKHQNQGIGRQVWSFLLSCYPTQSWRVETPTSIPRNIHFYRDICGFEWQHDHEGLSVFRWQGRSSAVYNQTNDNEYHGNE
ncbi:MAG: GNAT family N-acetyltransferase [Reinekea sp.]|nr:GNAT family N-acetyltransferase [Reinekea sp.]